MTSKSIVGRVRRRIAGKSAAPSAPDEGLLVKMGGARVLARTTNKIENKLLTGQGYDESNFEVVESIVREGDVCFDIGANIGVYSVVLSRAVGSGGQVHSFEPVRHIRRRLKTNVGLNGGRNVTINGFALGAEPGELEMFQVKEGQFRGGTSTFLHNNNVEAMGEEAFDREMVRIERLDDYVARMKIGRVDFMKIDVEGFEIHVLRGAAETLRKHRPAVLFEHDQARLSGLNMDESTLAALLQGLGYVCFEVTWTGQAARLAEFHFDRRLRGNNLLALHLEE